MDKDMEYVKNDYLFWKTYLVQTIEKIDRLLVNKDVIYADFHMHSDYSADGKQTLEEIIDKAQKLGLDIIAITDHDSIKVYDELYEHIVKDDFKSPIIIPGVEFTVENKEYGSQCHILQLMINPKEKSIIENVKYNEKAQWTRIKLQFKRISENNTLQYFIKKYNIICSEKNYKEFLDTCWRPIPEYDTLMKYIMKILSEHNITNWNVFEVLEENNKNDTCEARRNIKEKRLKILKERYEKREDADNSLRFLHSMLAIRGADDDYFPQYKSCGDLSVNNYNELKLEELNRNHLTVFAHPSQEKLDLINDLLKINDNICGMEFNKQCNYSNSMLFFDKAKELDMIQIIGSDSHTLDNILYKDMDFYVASKKELNKFVKKAREYINNK